MSLVIKMDNYQQAIDKLNEKYFNYCDICPERHQHDPEMYHIIRDEIICKFIEDISKNKFTLKEIISISKLIKKDILDMDATLWFA